MDTAFDPWNWARVAFWGLFALATLFAIVAFALRCSWAIIAPWWLARRRSNVRVRVVGKREETEEFGPPDAPGARLARTDWYVTFAFPDGVQLELKAPEHVYERVEEGDAGRLTHDGWWVTAFAASPDPFTASPKALPSGRDGESRGKLDVESTPQ